MIVRPYQAELLARVQCAFDEGRRRVLMQLPTGGGKTCVASEIIRHEVKQGRRVIFAAHLDVLLDDTSGRLTTAGVAHGIVQADRPTNPTAPVQVASLATLRRRNERPPCDLLIIDECRRVAAPGVREVLDGYQGARLLGLDGTPQRSDGSSLGDLFDLMVCGPSIATLTAEGFLVPAVVLSPPAPVDGALAMDPVEALVRHAPGRRAIVFCRDLAHAADVAARMPAPTTLVSGESSRAERQAARAHIESGELRCVVNCDVYREGADLPALDCVVIARGMTVVSAFLQAIGRGLRPFPGKRDCLVLDLTGAAIVHGLPGDERVWSLERAAVRRTGTGLEPVVRCPSCFAVLHPCAVCPRCGTALRARDRAPRRATRVERAELSRLDERPLWQRDELALKGIEKRLRSSGRFPAWKIAAIARSVFLKSHKRAPAARPVAP